MSFDHFTKRQYSLSCAFVRGELHFKSFYISYFNVFKPLTVNVKSIIQPLNVVLALGSPCISWYILMLHTFRGQNTFHVLCCALLLRRPAWQPKTYSCQMQSFPDSFRTSPLACEFLDFWSYLLVNAILSNSAQNFTDLAFNEMTVHFFKGGMTKYLRAYW